MKFSCCVHNGIWYNVTGLSISFKIPSKELTFWVYKTETSSRSQTIHFWIVVIIISNERRQQRRKNRMKNNTQNKRSAVQTMVCLCVCVCVSALHIHTGKWANSQYIQHKSLKSQHSIHIDGYVLCMNIDHNFSALRSKQRLRKKKTNEYIEMAHAPSS